MREVTVVDFYRADIPVDAKPEDYEFRSDGALVRKDRWQQGIYRIVSIVGLNNREFEIPELVERVRELAEHGKNSQHTEELKGALRWALDHLACSRPIEWDDAEDTEAHEKAKLALLADNEGREEMADQIKPRYRLGTQNMLDLAKDDATKIPERTLFRIADAVESTSDRALVDGDIVVRADFERELDDKHSVRFSTLGGVRTHYSKASWLQPLI